MARGYQSVFSRVKEKTLQKRSIRSRLKNRVIENTTEELTDTLEKPTKNTKPSDKNGLGLVIAKVSQEVQDIVSRNVQLRDGKKKSATLKTVDSIITNEIGPHFTLLKRLITKLQLEALDRNAYTTGKIDIVKQLVYIQSTMGSMIYKYFFAKEFLVDLDTAKDAFKAQRLKKLPAHFIVRDPRMLSSHIDGDWKESFLGAVSHAAVLRALHLLSDKFSVYEFSSEHELDVFDFANHTDIIAYEKKTHRLYCIDVKTLESKHYAAKTETTIHDKGFNNPEFEEELKKVAQKLGWDPKTPLYPYKVKVQTGLHYDLFTGENYKHNTQRYLQTLKFRLKEMSHHAKSLHQQ